MLTKLRLNYRTMFWESSWRQMQALLVNARYFLHHEARNERIYSKNVTYWLEVLEIGLNELQINLSTRKIICNFQILSIIDIYYFVNSTKLKNWIIRRSLPFSSYQFYYWNYRNSKRIRCFLIKTFFSHRHLNYWNFRHVKYNMNNK